MPRLLVFTLGFEEKFVIRMITRYGLSRGDGLLFITGPIIDKVRRALEFVRDFIDKYFPGQASIHVLEIKVLNDFITMVSKICKALADYSRVYDSIIVNLSGGMRLIILATYTAALIALKNGLRLNIEVETEDSSVKLAIPDIISLYDMIKGLTREKINILKVLAERALTASEIAEQLNTDVTTIRRHLQELSKRGIVERHGQRPVKYSIRREIKKIIELI